MDNVEDGMYAAEDEYAAEDKYNDVAVISPVMVQRRTLNPHYLYLDS